MSGIAIGELSADSAKGNFPDLLRKAADQGHAPSQYQIAKIYCEEGVDGRPDCAAASIWYEKAAKQGHTEAQYALGRLYQERRIRAWLPARKAVYWYRKAAEQGLAQAQHAVALCYEMGKGVRESAEETFNWTKKAADQNLPIARYNLGILHEMGLGTGKNAATALTLFADLICDGNHQQMVTDQFSQVARSRRTGLDPESKALLTIFPDRTSMPIGAFHDMLGRCHKALNFKITLG